jgi:hypothetical protein
MDDAAAPVLHASVPGASVESTEFPQLLTTVITGVAGIAFGAAVMVAAGLVHPFTDCVTVYDPAVFTVMDDVVAPVLHTRLLPVAVSVVVPQLSAADTAGAAGVAFGAAVMVAAALVHPFTDCVTVYDPAVFTVRDDVVAPVLHTRLLPVAVSVLLSQLSTADTTGAAGVDFGAAVTVAAGLVHPFTD